MVNGIVVNKEVDNRVVKQGVFKRMLLARKSVMGLNKLCRLLRILIASNLWLKEQPIEYSCKQ